MLPSNGLLGDTSVQSTIGICTTVSNLLYTHFHVYATMSVTAINCCLIYCCHGDVSSGRCVHKTSTTTVLVTVNNCLRLFVEHVNVAMIVVVGHMCKRTKSSFQATMLINCMFKHVMFPW